MPIFLVCFSLEILMHVCLNLQYMPRTRKLEVCIVGSYMINDTYFGKSWLKKYRFFFLTQNLPKSTDA